MTSSLSNFYSAADYFEIKFDKEVNWQFTYYPFVDVAKESDAVQYLGSDTWRIKFQESFPGWDHSVVETTIGQLSFSGAANSDTIPRILHARVCMNSEETTTVTVVTPTVDSGVITDAEFCESLDFVIDHSWTRGFMLISLAEDAIEGTFTSAGFVEIAFSSPVTWVEFYYPVEGGIELGSNVWRLNFYEDFAGFSNEVNPGQIGQVTFQGPGEGHPLVIFGQICEIEPGNSLFSFLNAK